MLPDHLPRGKEPVLNSRRENSMELTEAAMASSGKPSLAQSWGVGGGVG